MSALGEFDGWHAGALIRDANGDLPVSRDTGRQIWRYRAQPFVEEVFRAMAREGCTLADIEARCGWASKRGAAYLSRVLGLRPGSSTLRGGKSYRGRMGEKTISYENAVRIARALDLDFTMWEL